MSVALYFDHHIPEQLRDALRARGVDILTTQEDSTGDWEDERLLDRATELGRVIFTHDRDFLRIAKHYSTIGKEFYGIAYCPQLRMNIGSVASDLEILATVMEPEGIRNRVEFIPL